MLLTNDLLLGVLIGLALTVLVQQALKLGNRLMRPGCLIFIIILIFIFVALVFTGVIQFQAFA
jgi:hypothetical protein